MSELYLIRHGQASFGKENYDALSEKGVVQCRILGKHFKDIGLSFDAVYSGTLIRQSETARHVMKCLESKFTGPEILEGLNEYHTADIIKYYLPGMIKEDPSLEEAAAGIFTDRKAFQRIFWGAMKRWYKDSGPEGIESRSEFAGRAVSALGTIMKENSAGKRAAVFASGGSITACVQHVMGLPDTVTIETGWQMVNCSVTRIVYSGMKATLHSLNSYEHLLLAGKEHVTYR